MNFDKELLKGNIITIILSTLQDSAKYGYEIIKGLEESSNGVLKMKEGTLYPLLHSLEYDGYVSSKELISENGRKRKYYQLTKAGQKLLLDKKKEWKSFKLLIDQLVSRGVVNG
jgi:PadR family transcriptional regulator, regulatory protein PadR